MDTRSTNFDLDADLTCADCCTYPELQMRFRTTWSENGEEVPLRSDTFYHDVNNNPFRFERLRFYWSAIQVQLLDGSALSMIDSIQLTIAETPADTTTRVVVDDFMLGNISSTTAKAEVGTLYATGLATGFSGQLGVPDPANKTVVGTLASTHPLGPQINGMNLGTEVGYIFAKVEFFQDTIATDTLLRAINIYGPEVLQPIAYTLLDPTTLVEGRSPVFELDVDLGRLFNNIDVRSADTLGMKQQFVDNLTQIFQLTKLLNE
ncbi:MAG: MbnP family protein [Bacteroidota bacterium]